MSNNLAYKGRRSLAAKRAGARHAREQIGRCKECGASRPKGEPCPFGCEPADSLNLEQSFALDWDPGDY